MLNEIILKVCLKFDSQSEHRNKVTAPFLKSHKIKKYPCILNVSFLYTSIYHYHQINKQQSKFSSRPMILCVHRKYPLIKKTINAHTELKANSTINTVIAHTCVLAEIVNIFVYETNVHNFHLLACSMHLLYTLLMELHSNTIQITLL